MALRLGTIDSIRVERALRRLTMRVHLYPPRDEPVRDIVEEFESEAALLARYDELVAIDEGKAHV